MNKQIQLAAIAAAAIVLGGGGFVAGMTIGPGLGGSKADVSVAQAQTTGRQQVGAARAGGAGGAVVTASGAGQTVGRVISVNNDSITVEVRTPGSDTSRSVIALVGSSARIVKTTETEIKLGDIKAGDQVLIVGTPDAATGTISASAIVDGFNALGQLFGGGAAGGARPSGSGGARPSPSASPRP